MGGVSRRALGAAAMMFLLPGVAARAVTAIQAPKRQRLSLGLGAFTRPFHVRRLATFALTATFEAPFDAVRVGIANATPSPFQIGGICCCEAVRMGPRPDRPWRYFSFGQGRGDETSPGPARPQPVTVPGNAPLPTGATNVPRLLWSDWTEYRVKEPQARPQMLFRVLVPPQDVPMTAPHGPGYLSDLVPEAGDRFIDQGWVFGDHVSDPTAPVVDLRETPFCPIFVVQYRTTVPGFQIVVGGDSHLSAWYTFAEVAALRMSKPDLPVSTWNVAWGGQPSRTFWPLFDDAVDAGLPSVAVIQGWTANDGMRAESDEAYLADVKEMAVRTRALGGVPVIMKGMPRYLYGKPELDSWQHINQQLDHLVPDAAVFDPDPIVGNPERPGDWQSPYSTDMIHADLRGDLALAVPFERLLRSLGM